MNRDLSLLIQVSEFYAVPIAHKTTNIIGSVLKNGKIMLF